MYRNLMIGLALVLCSTLVGCQKPDESEVAKEVKAVVTQNVEASEKEDLKTVLKTIHKHSPLYRQTKLTLPFQFKKYDLRHELLACELIGTDGIYAVARVKERVTQKGTVTEEQRKANPNAPKFQDYETDLFVVFRKDRDNHQWQYWSQALIERHNIHPVTFPTGKPVRRWKEEDFKKTDPKETTPKEEKPTPPTPSTDKPKTDKPSTDKTKTDKPDPKKTDVKKETGEKKAGTDKPEVKKPGEKKPETKKPEEKKPAPKKPEEKKNDS